MASGLQMNAIFVGTLRAPVRDYYYALLTAARGRFTRLIAPCVGRFTVPLLAVAAGWDPKQIECSDVSLFSGVLGTLASGRSLESLGIDVVEESEVCEKFRACKDGGAREGAAALLALKYLAMRSDRHFEQTFLREMYARWDEFVDGMQAQVEVLCGKLHGITYRSSDLWDEVNPAKSDASTLLSINPPSYARGYEKMFDTKGRLTWREPTYGLYDPKTGDQQLFEVLREHTGLTLCLKSHHLEPLPREHAVFGMNLGKGRADFVVANKPDVARELHAIGIAQLKPTPVAPSKYPILGDEIPVPADATVTLATCGRPTALYYRDLFAHRLGVTSASWEFLVLVNGHIIGVAGVGSSSYAKMTGNVSGNYTNDMFLQYGIAAPSKRRRLNRLMLMALCTAEFRRIANHHLYLGLHGSDGMESTCLSPHPVVMGYRGIMDLVFRELRPDGTYRLRYRKDFSDESFADVFARWHASEVKRIGSPTLEEDSIARA